jgi:hypothetical protein
MVSAQRIDVRNVEFLHFSNEPICHFEHFCTVFLVTTDTFTDESNAPQLPGDSHGSSEFANVLFLIFCNEVKQRFEWFRHFRGCTAFEPFGQSLKDWPCGRRQLENLENDEGCRCKTLVGIAVQSNRKGKKNRG